MDPISLNTAELELDLIARARAGEGAAFEALMMRHARFVYNLALRTLGDPLEAEDVAQEAFVRAWRGLPQFRADARFGTWLYRIVTNLCYNRLPALRAGLEALDIDAGRHIADERAPVDTGLLAGELGARIRAAIDALPEGYRLLITLRHLQEMSYTDIAEVTGMPLGTVKTGIHRARRQLQLALDPDISPDIASGRAPEITPDIDTGPEPRSLAVDPGIPPPRPLPADARPHRSASEFTRLEVNHV